MTQEEKQFRSMTEEKLFPLIMKLSVPAVFSTLITSFYNLVDTYFVSNLGAAQSGAVSVVFSVQAIIQAAGFGIGMGGGSLISVCLGKKERKEAQTHASSSLFIAVLFGTLISLLGVFSLSGVMRLVGARGSILPYAMDYGRYILYGAPVMCASFVLHNVLRSQGKNTLAMIGITAGGVLNVLLDYLLIRKISLGVSGAAIATIISQCVSFLIMFFLVLSKNSIVRPSFRAISFQAREYAVIIKTGMPTFFRQGLASLSTATLSHVAGTLTANAVTNESLIAAVGIANKVYMLVRQVILGFGQGFQPVAGYNYGAKKYRRVREAFWIVTAVGTLVCLVFTVLIAGFAEDLMRFFIEDPDPEKTALVVRYGKIALISFCFELVLLSFSTFANMVLQALRQSAPATFLASCRQGVFYLPLIFLLPRFFGENGVLVCQAAADVCTFFISIPFLWAFFSKLKKEENANAVSA